MIGNSAPSMSILTTTWSSAVKCCASHVGKSTIGTLMLGKPGIDLLMAPPLIICSAVTIPKCSSPSRAPAAAGTATNRAAPALAGGRSCASARRSAMRPGALSEGSGRRRLNGSLKMRNIQDRIAAHWWSVNWSHVLGATGQPYLEANMLRCFEEPLGGTVTGGFGPWPLRKAVNSSRYGWIRGLASNAKTSQGCSPAWALMSS
mmetsp:Transcript_35211/g.111963  ORF Transcript_35211/g.111963 Transcript_35211/m.111963 type:complete len:204 (-) Transcript_35211:370-981(-)